MPMVASDGPHYGDNVKLDGPRQVQAQACDRASRRDCARALRPPHRQGNRRGRRGSSRSPSNTSSPTPASARRAATEPRPTPSPQSSTSCVFVALARCRACRRVRRRTLPVFKLVAKDGIFEPPTLEVAAGKKLQDRAQQRGHGPDRIRKQATSSRKRCWRRARKSSVVINPLKPGDVRVLRRVPSGAPRRARSSRNEPAPDEHSSHG